MKKASIILAGVGVGLFLLLFFCGVDVFDEQAFRWRVEVWMFAGSFLSIATALVLRAFSCHKWYFRGLLLVIALFPMYAVVDTVRFRPHLVYADERYQLWDNGDYWKLYHISGLVMDDAGGMSIHGETLDSCKVERYDSLGVMWVETWTNLNGEYFHHHGEILPISPRFASTDYSLHTAQLDSLLSVRIHDSEWYKTRTVLEGAGGQ